MAWQSVALVLPLFTLCFFVWLCPHASFAGDVSCWWSHITPDNRNVSIECHAEPQSFLQTCGRCNLSLVTSEKTTQAKLHWCSRSSANFFAFLAPQSIQFLNCKLSCPEQTPGNCIMKEGYPPPTCLIPLDDAHEDVHCHWTRSHYPPNPTTFTLHWEVATDSRYRGQRETGMNNSTIIQRTEYQTHFQTIVWVSALSALGSVRSNTTVFNTANIMEPHPPEITHHTFGPLEIFWIRDLEGYEGSSQEWQCEVQYKNEYDLDWIEALGTYDLSFVLHNSEPFTEYMFRVRCGIIIMSDWCSYTAETPPAAPVGKLDVWSDCEPDSDDPSCTILWKEMPKVQARSQISSYLVRVKLNNGSELDKAEYAAAGLCTQGRKVVEREVNNVTHCLSCHQEQKRCSCPYSQLRVPIRDVKDICVTASSMEGASVPAYVALPRPGLMIPEVLLRVRGKSNSLDVSWSVPQAFIQSILEYVVEHRTAGLPHKMCPNWVKVDKTQNCTTLKGQFWNYTAYNVSLFAVVNNCSYFLKSAVAYTVQGVPPEVTHLQVTHVFQRSATLTWKPIPLSKSRGIVLKYSVGLGNHTVWNVSSDKNSIHLPELNPGQQYEVWICAVTVAGDGERTTIRFTTITTGFSVIVVVSVLVSFIILIMLTVCLVWYCSQSPLTEWLKIPDPINSSLLKQKNNQIQPSWLVSHGHSEHTLMISEVEVILISDSCFDPELPQVEQQQTQPEEDQEHEVDGGKQECGGLVRINSMPHERSKDYRKVIDSSEEEASIDGEDEEWDESTSPSDYEKHFMPSVLDM